MGLFDKLKKKDGLPKTEAVKNETVKAAEIMVGAAVKGTVVPMAQIPDPVFAEGVLGQCCGIEPREGKVFAPVDGTIAQVSDTLHAVGIQGSQGEELFLHVGIDTVEMNGDGFAVSVQVGDTVRAGQQILTMDLEKIRAAGHPTVVMTVITNSPVFSNTELLAEGEVEVGEPLMKLAR